MQHYCRHALYQYSYMLEPVCAGLVSSTGQEWALPLLQIPQADFGPKTLADMDVPEYTVAAAKQFIQQGQATVTEITTAYTDALQSAGKSCICTFFMQVNATCCIRVQLKNRWLKATDVPHH